MRLNTRLTRNILFWGTIAVSIYLTAKHIMPNWGLVGSIVGAFMLSAWLNNKTIDQSIKEGVER